MDENHPPPTLKQKRLVDVAFVIQFYLAALGHLVLWCSMYWALVHTPVVEGPDEGRFILEIFVWRGIPVSFAFLVFVYIIFRLVLAGGDFAVALPTMIIFNVVHGIVLFFTVITPLRLAIPTILYGIAYFSYWKTCRDAAFSGRDPSVEPEPESKPEPQP